MRLAKEYALVHDGNRVILRGRIGNTVSTPHTIEQFDSKDEIITRIKILGLIVKIEI